MSDQSEAQHLVDDLAQSLDAVSSLIARVGADQWDAPTPCTDWTVRALVDHLIGINRVFAAMLTGEAPPHPSSSDQVEPDSLEAFRESADRLLTESTAPGVLEREFSGPLGVVTGRDRLQVRLSDLLAHGWDLATAIGAPANLPEGAAERALAHTRAHLTAEARAGKFGPEVPVGPDASAIVRLVAFLGREQAGESARN